MDCDCRIRPWRVGSARSRRLHASLPLCFQSLEHGSCTPLFIIHQNSRRAAYWATRVQSKIGVQFPTPSGSNRVIPALCCPWPLATANWLLPLDGRAVPALPCAGGLPPQRPPVATPPCRRVPSCRVKASQADATVPARFQPVASLYPFRPAPTVPIGSSPLATGRWQLSTIHCSPESAPNAPCKSLRNVLYCKVESERNQAPPERTASHNCPPTLPKPPAMSTCSELNVRTLPPANIAPGAAGTNRQCTTLQSAAPPTRSRTRRAMPPMPALPPPASVSCHEKHATDTILRTFCTKTTPFAHFQSKNDREPTATASCYESPRQYPVTRREKVFSKLGQSGQNSAFDTLSIPCRYPVSKKIAAGLRHIRTLLSQFWTESAPFLRMCAALPKRRPTPPLTSTQTSPPISARAGDVARDGAL